LKKPNILVDYGPPAPVWGALIAALYAFGKPLEEIEKIAKDLEWVGYSHLAISQYGLLSQSKTGEYIVRGILGRCQL
jgi:predicted acylesterase/phospholipase RssA